jgi:Smg protein
VKENVLDVLMYLFENYVDEGPDFPPDQEALASELAEAGFARGEISKAFSWLEGLSMTRERTAELVSTPGSVRHYTLAERRKLDLACRGFLHSMEAAGVLDATTRELVLDRVTALGLDEITLEQLKWVTWMVLFHQPGQEYAYRMFEDFVFDEREARLH